MAQAQGKITSDETAELVRRTADANAALMRGDAKTYFEVLPHTDDFMLMSPFGGKPTRASELTTERIEAIGRFFKNGTFEQELVQATVPLTWWSSRSLNDRMWRSAVCLRRTGRCGLPWSFAAKGPNGDWRIGTLTR
jgi:hypothetical protein